MIIFGYTFMAAFVAIVIILGLGNLLTEKRETGQAECRKRYGRYVHDKTSGCLL